MKWSPGIWQELLLTVVVRHSRREEGPCITIWTSVPNQGTGILDWITEKNDDWERIANLLELDLAVHES